VRRQQPGVLRAAKSFCELVSVECVFAAGAQIERSLANGNLQRNEVPRFSPHASDNMQISAFSQDTGQRTSCECYTEAAVRARLVAAAILTICIGGPIVEMFDRWDQTLQDGNDTEANVMIAALCVGVALSLAGSIVRRIRAISCSRAEKRICGSTVVRAVAFTFRGPIPTGSPPTPLRI
jgi:hypothetical protein